MVQRETAQARYKLTDLNQKAAIIVQFCCLMFNHIDTAFFLFAGW